MPGKPAERGTGPAQGWPGHKDGLYLDIRDSLCPGTRVGAEAVLPEVVLCLAHSRPRCLAPCLVWGPPAAAFLEQWDEGAHTLNACNNLRSPILGPSE